MKGKIKPYIISILAALGVGGLSALFTRNNMQIYNSINQPSLAPPMWVFPIVWTILFVLMGISSAMVYIRGDSNREARNEALWIYGLQLAVNFFWSLIFFNMRAFLFAFIWIMVLWVLIIVMIAKFKKISTTAAWLQVPYLVWVTFAAYLTLMVYTLN